MIDTHTHLYLQEFASDLVIDNEPVGASAVKRALAAGVSKFIFPNVDLSTCDPLTDLHRHFPDNTFIAQGLHPTEVDDTWKEQLSMIEKKFSGYFEKVVAIGEIGIDLYWDKKFKDKQMQALEEQCIRAVELNLPVIIHCRDGLNETLEVISGINDLQGVFHCFTGTVEDVEKIRKTGDYFFGIGGVATFKNSKMDNSLKAIGIDRILLETDSPYLAPVPHRGKRNESSYLVAVNNKIASVLELRPEEVSSLTDKNALKLFHLPET